MSRATQRVLPLARIFGVDWYAWIYRRYFSLAASGTLTIPVLGGIVAWAMFGFNVKAWVGLLFLPWSAACIAMMVNAFLLWQRIRKILQIVTLGNSVTVRITSIQLPQDIAQGIEITTVCDISGGRSVRKYRICSFCKLGSLRIGDTVSVLTTRPTASDGLIAELLFSRPEDQHRNHAWWCFWS